MRPIGEGGMASVFLAVQESLDREVALKVMAPALAANAEFTERFLKEGRITAKLNHANLVTVFDIGSYGSVYYLAAEYIPGGTLREKIQAGMRVGEALDVACDIARGLDFAHAKGFVHRDVKPGNILFKADGVAVLADFGIAKAMDAQSGATMAGASIGTPDYMSPEQARAEAVDGRSDLYSLGAVLFEMLEGHPPYEAGDPFTVALMHVTQPVPTLSAEHAWLQPLIDALMAKLPEQRVGSGEEFMQAVETLLAASPQAASIARARVVRRRNAGGNRHSMTQSRSARTGATVRGVPAQARAPRWMLPVFALAGGVLVGVAAWWWFAAKPPVGISPPPAEPVAQSAPAPQVTQPQPIDASSSEIPALLLQADTYRDYGTKQELSRRLTFPPGENAVDLYRRVLALDPANTRARQGLADVAKFYLDSARGFCDRELWPVCGNLATDGLKAEPDNVQLKALVERAQAAARGG
nr:serine/threonine-protein kinase [Chiayiivirga flava]